MNKKIEKITFFLGAIFAFLSKAGFVFALEVQYPSFNVFGQSFALTSYSSLTDYTCYLFGLGLDIAIVIAIGAIAFGGIYYLVSYARESYKGEGKAWIKAGILGLLIVVCASLVSYTINPNLSACKFLFFPEIDFGLLTSTPPTSTLPTTTYKEIPMGTLTENLLTRTMSDCYEFDPSGNPLDYADVIGVDNSTIHQDDTLADYSSPTYYIPTYFDHDRADCLTQLIDGAQKKAGVIATLSQEIAKLMNECSCSNSGSITSPSGASGVPTSSTFNSSQAQTLNPSATSQDITQEQDQWNSEISGIGGADFGSKCSASSGCGWGEGCNVYGTDSPISTEDCSGFCEGDCCPSLSPGSDSGSCKNSSGSDCCPSGVKDKIENGDISVTVPVGGGDCKTEATDYKGLDEFRCPKTNNCSDDSCDLCDGGSIESFVQETVIVNGETITLIKQKEWKELNLLQQTMYFKTKIDEITQTIQDDEDSLKSAKTQLASCYLAMPYVDVAKTFEGTIKEQSIILATKFTDTNGDPVDSSKYCQGFNWDNSSCLKKCDNECPDTGGDYSGCTDASCVLDAYNSRSCPYGDGSSSTFEDCMSSCQTNLTTDCEKKDLSCSYAYDFCNYQAENNGKCVLTNDDKCLFDDKAAANFASCSDTTTHAQDEGNKKYCIDNAYLCENGSNEYAGYQECVDTTGGCSADKYSSSQLYYDRISNDGDCQKCSQPYSPPAQDSACYSSKASSTTSCQTLCPETSKCQAASKCPDCPCDEIANPSDQKQPQTVKFYSPDDSSGPWGPEGICGWPFMSDSGSIGSDGYTTASKNISAYDIVGPQCNQYSYNDDPLTFYCQDQWWNDPAREGLSTTPIGAERVCSQGGDVPVGQTVDDAINWADSIIGSVNGSTDTSYIQSGSNFDEDIQSMIDKMTTLGDAIDDPIIDNYCKCNARSETPTTRFAKPIANIGR